MEPGKKKKGFGKLPQTYGFHQIDRELHMQVKTCGRSRIFGSHFQPSRLSGQNYNNPRQNSSRVHRTDRIDQLSKPKTILKRVLITTFVFLVAAFGNQPLVSAQRGPKVVTTTAGVTFEGDLFDTQSISATTSPFAPYTKNTKIVAVDDGYRRIFLNPDLILPTFGNSTRLASEIQFDTSQRTFSANGSKGQGTFVGVSQFNEKGHRTLTVQTSQGQKSYTQGITKITPRYVIVETLVGAKPPKQWKMYLARGTVPKSVLRNVLLINVVNPEKAEEYFDIATFWQQIGDFNMAEQELLLIQAKFPDMSDRISEIREELLQLKARQALKEIAVWMDSGQTELGLKLAGVFNDMPGLAGETQAAFRDIAETKLKSDQDVELKRTKVLDLLKRYKALDAEEESAIRAFKNELETDLRASNSARLDSFIRLADAAQTPDSFKVALAISGWVCGSNEATENFSVTSEMFSVRSLVREFLTRGTTKPRRTEILKQLSKFESSEPKYIDAMIKQMLPIDPPDLTNYNREKPIEFEVTATPTLAKPEVQKYKCLVHLPPQYDPFRNYPMILTLPGAKQTLEQHLNMWCGPYNQKLQVRAGHAMRNGYIVVAVQWNDPGQSRWKYSGREHQIVNKALRAAMRKFSIDSDRVFLSGHGIGGDGAYDIGISHPEHWAGVLGFSGAFGKYIDNYRINSNVNLPMYCVNGSKHFGAINASQKAQNDWMAKQNRGYPDLTVVHYKGRTNELFMEELPEAMKWMKPQRRRWPDTSGFEFECVSLRPWDSYFWFYEMYGTPERNVVRPELFSISKNFQNKIVFMGKMKSPNVFRIEPTNTKGIPNRSTLWLSPEYVDFAEKVQIQGRGKFNGEVYPSREVLLNDVRRRADREHPFWGRIDHDGAWKANPSDKVGGG